MFDICVTTQKKLSFACETIDEPDPIINTTRTLAISDVKPSEGRKGRIKEEAVIRATVDDPCAVLSTTAIMNGSQIPQIQTRKS
jgi:hypothetical protein